MGCVLGQNDELGRKERVIYYLRKKFYEYKLKYTMLGKTCWLYFGLPNDSALYALFHYPTTLTNGSLEVSVRKASTVGVDSKVTAFIGKI